MRINVDRMRLLVLAVFIVGVLTFGTGASLSDSWTGSGALAALGLVVAVMGPPIAGLACELSQLPMPPRQKGRRMIRVHHPHRHSPHDDYAHGGVEDHDHDIPLPSDLWAQAAKEHPRSPEKRQDRYVELMVEHGHVRLDKADDDESDDA